MAVGSGQVVMTSVSRSCPCVAVSAIRPLPKAAEAMGLRPDEQASLGPYHLFEYEATIAIVPEDGAMAASATELNGNVERHMKSDLIVNGVCPATSHLRHAWS